MAGPTARDGAPGRSSEAIRLRGIRGATTVDVNAKDAVLDATRELLTALIQANDISADDVVSAFFSTTRDVDAEFPALAARHLGWSHVAMMCFHEMDVPGALPRCIRVLLHVHTALAQDEVRFIYQNEATRLRPDLFADGVRQADGGQPGGEDR